MLGGCAEGGGGCAEEGGVVPKVVEVVLKVLGGCGGWARFAGAVRGYASCAALYFSLSSFRSLRLFRHTARGGLRQLCY